ncbi:MAG TPA: hypothetical protein VFV30_04350 [Novosphingobium sp.]|nr:hypothetical protein [Novosphingobium sp.]
MARAIALVAQTSLPPIVVLRPLVVYGCALALILAGPALPALGL